MMTLSRRATLLGLGASVAAWGPASSARPTVPLQSSSGEDGWWNQFGGTTIRAPDIGASMSSPDNQPALQQAMDRLAALGRPARLLIPEGIWRLQRPLLLRSNVLLEGEGPRSELRNEVNGYFKDQTTLLVGAMMPTGKSRQGLAGSITSLDNYGVAPSGAGETSVSLRHPQDGRSLQVGSVVFLYSAEGASGAAWRFYQQMTQITAIEGGRVHLAHPLYKDFDSSDPRIGAVSSRWIEGMASGKEPAYVAQNCGVRNLSLYSENGRALFFSGVLNGRFSNLQIPRTTLMLVGNAMAHCSVDKIQGVARDNAINTAYFSHDRIITNVEARWDGRPSQNRTGCALLIEENCHDTLTQGISYDAGDSPTIATAVRISKAGERNVVEDFTFHSDGSSSGATVEINYREGGPRGDNVIRRLTAERPNAQGPSLAVRRAPMRDDGKDSPPDRIEDCRIIMPNARAPAIDVANSGLIVRNLETSSGDATVTEDARGVDIEGWRPDRPGRVLRRANDTVINGQRGPAAGGDRSSTDRRLDRWR